MANTISRNLIFIVLLIIVVFSLLGTWTILESSTTASGDSPIEVPVTTGRVAIYIEPPSEVMNEDAEQGGGE